MPLNDVVPTLASYFISHPVPSLLVSLPVTLLFYIFFNELVRYRARVPGLKGPPGLPLIGNLWSVRSNAAAQYKEWSKSYGDVYQVQMGNVPVVVVNSAKATKALWVGQSQALSSRPVTYTFHKASRSASLSCSEHCLCMRFIEEVTDTRGIDTGGIINCRSYNRDLSV